MKKLWFIPIVLMVTALSIGSLLHSSFSQTMPMDTVRSLPPDKVMMDPEVKVDGIVEVEKKIVDIRDSLKLENLITESEIKKSQELTSVQLSNNKELATVKTILARAQQLANQRIKQMPEIILLYKKPAPSELPVMLSAPSADTVQVPKHKRRFRDILLFWIHNEN